MRRGRDLYGVRAVPGSTAGRRDALAERIGRLTRDGRGTRTSRYTISYRLPLARSRCARRRSSA